MRSFLFVVGVASAHYSEWWTKNAEMMESMACANGPVACGGADIHCMAGYACLTTSAGNKICDDVARYQCKKTTCTDDKVLNPLRYCDCITKEERAAMFCADAPAVTGTADNGNILGAPMEISCPDGSTLTCNAGTLGCYDMSSMLCPQQNIVGAPTTINCPDGSTVNCNEGTLGCYENSSMLCPQQNMVETMVENMVVEGDMINCPDGTTVLCN